jgi:hypothetical protein
MNARTFFAGCGFGIALTLAYTWELLSPAHIDGIYLRALPVSTVAGGAAIDLAAIFLLAWALLAWALRRDSDLRSPLWVLLFALVPAILLRTALTLAELPTRIPSTLLLALFLLAPGLLLWRFAPEVWHRLTTFFLWTFTCLGLSILWVMPQLLSATFRAQPTESLVSGRTPVAAASAATPVQPRIVWVLFDELSYDQTFDHRQPGLALAAFDQLRSESFTFSAVNPAGYYTDQIVPALLRGRPVAGIRSTLDGLLQLRESSSARWQSFEPASTLFADARTLGWSTAIAGWFNPYCRLFGQIVDSCLWVPETHLFPGHMSTANSVWQNALAPLFTKFHSKAELSLPAEHRAAYPILLDRSLALVADPSFRFLFLHLPVPHPPAIYSRSNGRLQTGGSYLDNLALADRTLGELRAAIRRSPEANSTILIVSSDHSMRVPKWRGGLYWTQEDERTFGSRFDPRPVLAVHFPGQSSPAAFDRPFDELRTHNLIEELLNGHIGSSATLQAWLDENPLN